MIDFHTHILPGIDDGCRSAAESVELLLALQRQGVETVAATPHFYADQTDPDSFFRRRQAARARLLAAAPGGRYPELRLGAEVLFYPGIRRMEALGRFTLEGTDLLLLEMPPAPWSESAVGELLELSQTPGLRVLLAHVERYLGRRELDLWERLLAQGILTQTNVSFFLNRRTRRLALELLRNGWITALGTDCHGLRRRPPRMGEAAALLTRRLGSQTMHELDILHKRMLKTCEVVS